jgi:hypothetical protein
LKNRPPASSGRREYLNTERVRRPLRQLLNSSGTVIATNDDWEPTLGATFSAVDAHPLAMASSQG